MGLKFKNKKNEVLILKESSNSVAALIFGIIFLCVGGGLTFFGYFKPVLECRRIGAATNCELTRQGVFPFKTHRIIINDFTGAEIKTHDDSDGDTYSVILTSADGQRVPFVNYSSSGYNGKAEIAREIEKKLQTQKDFRVEYSQKPLLWTGLFFTFFSLLMLWSFIKYGLSERSVLEADFTQGLLKIYPYNSVKKYEDARPVSDLQDISIESAPKYWKAYALYMQQICQLKGLSVPIAVTIMLKAASFLGGVRSDDDDGEAKDGREQARNHILVLKFKDSYEAYVQLTYYGNNFDALSEFKKYLGLNNE